MNIRRRKDSRKESKTDNKIGRSLMASKADVVNYYSMLKYLYPEIGNKTIDIEMCDTIDDVYALVLCKWCGTLAKQGLYKEYVTIENEELTSPRGQINFQETIARQTIKTGKIVCSYDELSENIYLNKIIKGTLQYFSHEETINDNIKTEIMKAMQMFNAVDYTDIKTIAWKNIRYNNSTIRYKHPIELCKTYIDEHKEIKKGNYTDSERLYILFKRQMLKFIKQKFSENRTVEVFDRPYTLDTEPEFEVKLFKRQMLIAISNDTHSLLYMIRLQDEKALRNEDNILLKRSHEFVKYMREFKVDHGTVVNGTMIYVNIDNRKLNLQPMNINVYDDYAIGELTVDIYDQWRFIENKLEEPIKFFIQRSERKAFVHS